MPVVNTTSVNNVTIVMAQATDPVFVLTLTVLGIILTVMAFISRWAVIGFIAAVVCLISSMMIPYAMWSDGATLTLYLGNMPLQYFMMTLAIVDFLVGAFKTIIGIRVRE